MKCTLTEYDNTKKIEISALPSSCQNNNVRHKDTNVIQYTVNSLILLPSD